MRTLKEYTALLVKSIKLLSWPVGSIYISTKSTDPHKLFGGTWEPIQDTFLWCAGPKHAAGTSGGEETHTLTVDEMSAHSHSGQTSWNGAHTHQVSRNLDISNEEANWSAGSRDTIGNYDGSSTFVTSSSGGHNHTFTTDNSGGGAAHNNMPPFRSVYCWHRIA